MKRFLVGVIIFSICLSLIGCNIFSTLFNDVSDDGIDRYSSSIKHNISNKLKQKVTEQLDPIKVFGKDRITLAFYGLDKTEERVKTLGSFRSDTIIVIPIDFVTKEISMLSIPRDTYVKIRRLDKNGQVTSEFMERINTAYPYGGGAKGFGFENSNYVVSEFIGNRDIDYYFGMDMQAITPIVDEMGGVDFYVDVTYTKKGINLQEGQQIVNGNTAQQYVRFRSSPMGDIDRIQRQQRFILALLKDINNKGLNAESIIKIYKTFKQMTYTDLSILEIMSLATFFKELDLDNTNRFYAPGWFMNKDNKSFWNPNMDKLEPILEQMFGDDVEVD